MLTVLLSLPLLVPALRAASTAQFKSATYEISELDYYPPITLVCNPPPSSTNSISVMVRLSHETTGQDDFAAWWGPTIVVSFYSGQSEATLRVPVADDGLPEPDETSRLSIIGVTGGAVAGAITNATLIIHNGRTSVSLFELPFFRWDPTMPVPSLAAVSETNALATVMVYRTGDTNRSVTIEYATRDDTAVAGVDYEARAGTLTFAAGQRTNAFTVPIIDNGRVDKPRAFQLTLSNPSPDVDILAEQGMVAIFDDEIPVAVDRNFHAPLPVHWPPYGSGVPVLQFTRDGSIDPRFTPALLSSRSGGDPTYEQVRDARGRVIVSGFFDSVNGVARNGLARLNQNGSLDPTFQPPAELSWGPAHKLVAVDSESRPLVLDDCGSLRRFNTDGSLDTDFRPGLTPLCVSRILALPDGRVLVAGASGDGTNTHLLWRLDAAGQVDPTFHQAEFGPPSDWLGISDAKTQPDGKIVVGGSFSSIEGHDRMGVARLNADGTVDTTFAPPPGLGGSVLAVLPDTKGRVLVGGQYLATGGASTAYGSGPFDLVRFNPDGSLDYTFGPLSLPEESLFRPGSVDVTDLAVDGDGVLVSGYAFSLHRWFSTSSLLNYSFSAELSCKKPNKFARQVFKT